MTWDVLAGLDDAHRREVLATTTRRRFRKGDIVFHEGDPGDTFHIIEKGHVSVRITTPLGDVATLSVLGPGDSFGELALVGRERTRTATVEALEPVETRALHRRDLDELVSRHPTLHAVLVEVLADSVERLSRAVLEALYVSAEQRVLRQLARLTDLWCEPGVEPVEIPVTQEMLATMAGTTRPTANRVLQDAAERGVVELRRGRLVVLDRARLGPASP